MKTPFRIALLAPLIAPIAQPFIGGAQAMLRDLAAGLAERGHAVTLYAADGSDPALLGAARLVMFGVDSAQLQPARFAGHATSPAADQAPTSDDGEQAQRMNLAFSRAYEMIASQANQHDLLHAHAYDWPAFAYAVRQPLPVLHTLHLPVGDRRIRDELTRLAPPQETLLPTGKSVRLATVSHACAATYAPFCQIDAVIYNGIAVAHIPFGAQADPAGYLLYAGRITPEKGVEDALEIAARVGRPLLLAGGVYDQAYFSERIAPRLAEGDKADAGARYLGQVSRERLWELMAGAVATLCPSHWAEPFGLVACEAQAAGSPVVAYAQGGLREVIADGVTGALVAPGDLDGAAEAVSWIGEISRATCRAHVIERFSLGRMLDDYEALYGRMMGG